MANNYEAIVRAVLDQGQFNSDMADLQNKKYELRNLHVEPSNLAKEIQNALNSHRFNIDINPTINSGRFGSSGKSLAQAVETAINSGIGDHSVTVNLKDALQFKGIDSKVADGIVKSVSKDIDSATIKLKSFDAQFEETIKNGRRLQSIRFVGIDEDGKTLNILSKIDKKTGEVASTVTHVTQKFDVVTKSTDKTQEAFKRLLSVQREMGSVELDLEKASSTKDGEKIEELRRQLRNLQTEYTNLYSEIGSGLSIDQRNRLSDEAERATKKIRELRASTQDDIRLKLSTSEIDVDISNVKRRISELKSSSNGDIIDLGLEDDLANLQKARSMMDGQSGTELVDSYNDLSILLDTIRNKLTIISNENKGVVSSLQVSTLDNKMKTWLEKNTNASKDFGESINHLRQRLSSLDVSSSDAVAQLDRIEKEFRSIQQAAIAAGKTGNSFFTTLKKSFSGLLGIFSVAELFDRTVDMLRDMCQQVYDIDTAMIELLKVTDETDIRYDKFLNDASGSAKELGRSVSSLIEQSATWAKLGYSLDEAEELAKLSSIYANVADVDDATAVSDMVTAMKAFNIEAGNAVNIIDPLNELGNNFATSAADLGEGLSKSASAMNAAGTDMYKTLAMLTGGAEITQDAGEFGNFLKVASMRIRGMKGELEELGEEVDESVDSISKVQTQILNLTHGKVNIFDDMGEFRDYYDIMKDIADVMDELTSTEQAALSEILFGKMRGNQGQALIQAFQSGRIEEAYNVAIGSSGSAFAEQEKYMEGLQAKVNQFKAAWQELSITVLNSDFLKGIVDAGTTLLSTLTKIIDSIGVLNTAMIGVGFAALLKNFD